MVLRSTSLRSRINHVVIPQVRALPMRNYRLKLLLMVMVIPSLGRTPQLAHAACTMYCNGGDTLLTPTTCRDTVSATGVCTGRFTRSGGSCVAPQCPGIVSTKWANQGLCCTGGRVPVPSSDSCFDLGLGWWLCDTGAERWCYDDQPGPSPNCPAGSSLSNGNCVRSFPMGYTCPSGYTLSGTSCYMDYDASTISNEAECTIAAPATDGCQWCSSISICLPTASTCPATCPDAAQSICTVTPSSTQCQWCATSISIGVCQQRSGNCWATCTSASDDPLSPNLCTTSADCKWCPTLGYCTEQTRDCHTQCTTVAPDEPAICQVQSIQAQCEWCGAPGSVEYCVAVTDEPRLRCAASCGGLIWRPDVCNGALECHWCGVHNAAQGGRCKPLPGKSRGYVAWRREVECATGSESDTLSLIVTTSLSISFSPSSTVSVRSTLSPSFQGSLSLSTSGTLSNTQNPSLSNETSASLSMTLSSSHSRFTSSLKVITISLSVTLSNSSTSTATLQPAASRYYWQNRTIVEAVTTFLALGLMVPSVLGGIGGGTMTSSLSRVIASRNVGQCWGQAGGSVFSLPVDLCDFSTNDEDQLEGQGDAMIGVVVVLCGVVLLTLCSLGVWKWKQTSFRMVAEDVSIVSVLTPLWVAAVPLVVGGAVTATVAPMTSEHPLANTCGATAALIAVCVVLTLLL